MIPSAGVSREYFDFSLLDSASVNADTVVSADGLTMTATWSGGYNSAGVRSTLGIVNADARVFKRYWEVTVNAAPAGADISVIGVFRGTSLPSNGPPGSGSDVGYGSDGNWYRNGFATAYGATWTAGDVIGVLLDPSNGNLTFYKNGASQGLLAGALSPGSSTAYYAGAGFFFGAAIGATGSFTFNFGASSFGYSVPAGSQPGIYIPGWKAGVNMQDLFSQGTITFGGDGHVNGGPAPYWFFPASSGISTSVGTGYWIQVTKTGGTRNFTGAGTTGWTNISSGATVGISSALGNVVGTYSVSTSSAGTGARGPAAISINPTI